MMESKTGLIHISDFSRQAFFCFLEHMYLDSPGDGWDWNVDARELWSLADKYDVPSVKEFLLNTLDEFNTPAAAAYALAHWDAAGNPLAEACRTASVKHLRRMTAFEGIPANVVKLLLSSDVGGRRAQVDRFQLIMRWCEANQVDATSSEAQELVGEIRFASMRWEDIESIVRPSGLLSEQQISAY
eukprot:CAMPEP_0173396744 /NCGR_PEP_ID=MMETSP1356-20130122/36428_1 /TAXON_ID=77927 ORGANISM="Hemiselmis virescens, Strain PCC157" /NCGR_SAMPLE_ID=MMETSP1356 /ASSEMBLY_ACC=CAM_ASM_000847 /LENGTH=185 /DNA_ID=CAMNT_0014355843 /DNA_START=155 /DNA_END=709 /DNA_ORIENTATION=+